MNKENAILKINKAGKIGKIVCIVASVLVGIVAVIGLVAAITLTAFPKNFVSVSTTTSTSTSVDLSMFMKDLSNEQKQSTFDQIRNSINSNVTEQVNGVDVSVNADISDDAVLTVDSSDVTVKMTFSTITRYVYLATVILAFAFVSTFFAGRLCKSFADCASPFDADVIKKLRYFAFSLIPWTVSASFITFETSPTTALSKFNCNVNFGMIFITLAVLGLSYIFKYGAILQQESDETL